jgi:hypothetical protein
MDLPDTERLDPDRWLRQESDLPFVKIIDGCVLPMEPRDWIDVWRNATLRPPVPREIMLRFEQARACVAYGCFFYPLYGLGIGQLLRVADAAMLARCEQLGAPKKPNTFEARIEWIASSGFVSNFDKAYWHRLRHFRNEDTHEPPATIVPAGAAQRFLKAISEEMQHLFSKTSESSDSI